MLNGEKFKKEIEDVDYDLAKCKGKIVNCYTTNNQYSLEGLGLC